ncbi:MAG: outer membrane lipoprotein carrier protein LolA [Thermodesulfobacteriota bacterium]|nr:outer membrane lipoprotein carrier protein LolA [Thermodesulfobacteriota bacterium]
MAKPILDELVKSCHSRENGNLWDSNCTKRSRLERDLRRNDKTLPFQAFYKTFIFLILVFSLFLPFASIEAQTLTVDEVVQRIRESREKTKDFSADLLQEKKISLLKEKVISKGKIRFKKPDKISIEFFHPETSQMVYDGKTFLLYFKEEKMAERYQVQGNPVVEKYMLFSKDPFQEKLAQWRIVEDRETVLALEILPKVKDALFVKTRMWISKKDWTMTAMEMVEKNGDTTTLRYSNVRVNMGLADSDFEIRLPKDVKVTEIK